MDKEKTYLKSVAEDMAWIRRHIEEQEIERTDKHTKRSEDVRMRLYLSGPITGVNDYRERFKKAEKALRADGITDIVNPAELIGVLSPESTSWDEYMRIDLELLSMSDVLILLPGWQQSLGCQREYGFAQASDKIIMEFGDMIKHWREDIMETSGDIDDGDSYKAKITRKRGKRVGKDKRRRR